MQNINDAKIKIPGHLFEAASTMDVAGNLHVCELVMHHDEYSFEEPLSFKASITNTGEALTVVGHVIGQAKVECARCLEPVEVPFDCEFDDYILLKAPESADSAQKNGQDASQDSRACAGEHNKHVSDINAKQGKRNKNEKNASYDEDEAWGSDETGEELIDGEYSVLPGSHVVDMWPSIESALRLSAPIMPLCSEECLGICPICGANRNTQKCTCAEQEDFSDSPFAVLKDFKFED